MLTVWLAHTLVLTFDKKDIWSLFQSAKETGCSKSLYGIEYLLLGGPRIESYRSIHMGMDRTGRTFLDTRVLNESDKGGYPCN